MTICLECGAETNNDLDCAALFEACLAREFEDPNYWAVHHLTVAAYKLQHSSQLSKEGWLAMRQLLREFLIENKSPVQIKKQNKVFVDSGQRKWKVTSRSGAAFIPRELWTKTITNVRLTDYNSYQADITDWARTVLKNSESVDFLSQAD